MEKALASEDNTSLMKGKSYSKLQMFVQMDGWFHANIASVDSGMNMYNFLKSRYNFRGFWAFLQNKVASEHP